jgi:hypothetical protein
VPVGGAGARASLFTPQRAREARERGGGGGGGGGFETVWRCSARDKGEAVTGLQDETQA